MFECFTVLFRLFACLFLFCLRCANIFIVICLLFLFFVLQYIDRVLFYSCVFRSVFVYICACFDALVRCETDCGNVNVFSISE